MTEHEASIDMDKLPRVQYLILEVLAARWRTGELNWTFPSRLLPHVARLGATGLVGWKSGIMPRTFMVWLTEEGKRRVLNPTYVPPNER